jgi:hypothetical protein
MMKMKRAELDTTNPPGQIDNTKALDAFAYVPKRHTLGEYIDKTLKHEAMLERQVLKKKMTFDEWLRLSSFIEPDAGTRIWLQDCWKAAQENV